MDSLNLCRARMLNGNAGKNDATRLADYIRRNTDIAYCIAYYALWP